MMDKRFKPDSNKTIAITNGFLTYQGNPCGKGHTGIRYTKSSTCVDCIKSARNLNLNPRQRSDKNQELSRLAIDSGDVTYVPNKPCKLGHNLRFVNSNNCIECDKLMRLKHKITQKYCRIKKEYGLSKDKYLELVFIQNSSCKICGHHELDHFKLHIDHCHKTNKVRGLLCQKCNQAIGLLNHNSNLIRLAADYCE